MIIVVNRMQKVNIVGMGQVERISSPNIGQDFPSHMMSLGDVSVQIFRLDEYRQNSIHD